MKAQLATPAAGSPARSPSRVQRQASAGPAPDTPRGLPARAGRSEHAAIHAAAAHGIATPWSALAHAGAIPRSLLHAGAIPRSLGRHDVPSIQAHTGDAAATAAPAPSSSVQHPAQGASAPMQAAPADHARQEGAAEGDGSSAPGVPASASGKAVAFAGVPGMRPSTQVLASRAIAQPKLSIDGPRGAAAAAAIAPTGGGSPLPDPTRARMEGLFGVHLDGVRVVESGQPEQLGARALTIGHEIHAARGEDLAASRNTELLGHELAHVVQQRQGRARPGAAQDHGGALVVDAALEAEADAVGARIGRGEPAGIGGAAAACPAPVAQGYGIRLGWHGPTFDSVDELIETFPANLAPNGGWADHHAILSQWMKMAGDRTFRSRAELIDALNTVSQLVGSYRGVFKISENADDLHAFVKAKQGNKVITQVPQERGDMFDVASALALDPQLRVAVIPDGRADDCDKILDFYRDFKDRIYLLTDVKCNRTAFESVSRSTEYMYQSHERSKDDPRDAQAFRDTLANTTTGPEPSNDEKAAFKKALIEHGFKKNGCYVLVMYRESGHHPGPGRSPSHPELDTGTQGFRQLGTIIREVLGDARIPVPMGTIPNGFNKEMQPNLIEYWNWDCFDNYPEGTNRRQKENLLLHYLRDNCDVVAIGMRSGAMDALAYAGIPIISIDIAAEFMSEEDRQQHHIEGHSASSWRRPVKKEAMLPGTYHNVYLSELREDRNVGKLYGAGRQPAVEFTGPFGREDQRRIGEAVARYFDTTGTAAGGDFHPTSPLSYAGVKELLEHRKLDSESARGFILKWAKDKKAMRKLFEDYGYKSSPRPRESAAAARYR